LRRSAARTAEGPHRPQDQEARTQRQMVKALRVVFFGTPRFAVPTLDGLLASRHQVVGVVTQPDRPRGRGQRVVDAPVKQRAVERGLPLFQPDRLRDALFLDAFRSLDSDLGIVAAYGKILTRDVLDAPRL